LSAVSTYAEALFEAARERDELEDVLEELQEFTIALDESEELRLFFYGGQIPEREKRRAIDALTEGMTLSTRNFLKVPRTTAGRRSWTRCSCATRSS
jgi:F-type H+-transporting ATPase subunit delta